MVAGIDEPIQAVHQNDFLLYRWEKYRKQHSAKLADLTADGVEKVRL